MDISQSNQNEAEIIKVLEKFGFKFFGYNESKQALVMASNGQIIEAQRAYEFLQSQLQTAQSSNVTGVEAIPQVPVATEMPVERIPNLDANVEKGESTVESEQKFSEQILETGGASIPKITLPETKNSTYSDGYSNFTNVNLDLTNPDNLLRLEEFVKENAKKENSDPLKWLSYMFQKAVQEQQDKLYK